MFLFSTVPWDNVAGRVIDVSLKLMPQKLFCDRQEKNPDLSFLEYPWMEGESLWILFWMKFVFSICEGF